MGWGDEVLSAAVDSARAASLDDLSASVVPRLRSLVSAACASLYRYDQDGRLVVYSRDLDLSDYSADVYRADPAHGLGRRLVPRPRIVDVSRQLGRTWRHNPVYGHYYRPRDYEHLVCTWLTQRPYGEPGFVGVFLARTAKQGQFSPRELRALESAIPALAGAVGRGLANEATRREQETLEAVLASDGQRPLMAFDTGGRLRWCSSQAAAALSPVPDELVAAVRRLGDAARGRLRALPALAVSCVAGGCALRADLSLSATRTGEPVVVVALDFVRPGVAGVGEVARRHGLTPAETRVLGWILVGLSNKEIAARLDVSIETVRTHSKRVLGKLGVSTRFQAALLIMKPRAVG